MKNFILFLIFIYPLISYSQSSSDSSLDSTSRGNDSKTKVTIIKQYPKHKVYHSFGAVYGDPGTINLVYMAHFTRHLGLKLTLGYFPETSPGFDSGMQMNFLYNISKSLNFEQNSSLAIGYGFERINLELWDHDKDKYVPSGIIVDIEHPYAGVFYDISYYNIYGEIGLVFPLKDIVVETQFGDYVLPFYSVQIGYVYRFNKNIK